MCVNLWQCNLALIAQFNIILIRASIFQLEAKILRIA